MKTITSAVIALSVLASATAFAGVREGGNGGDAVVCRNSAGAIQSAQLLDYYEGQARAEEIELGSGTPRERVEVALHRIAKYSPSLAQVIQKETETLTHAIEVFQITGKNTDTVIFTSAQLQDIPDSSHLIYPADCKVEQLIIRLDREDQGEFGGFEYLIQKDIWNHLDENSKAGIVLHEALYKHGSEALEQKDSRKARYLNSVLSGKAIDQMNIVEFARNLAIAGYTKLWTPHFNITDIRHIRPTEDGFYQADGTSSELPGNLPYAVSTIIFDANGVMDVERTRLANPRTIYFQTLLNNGADITVTVDNQIIYSFNKSELVDVDDPLAYGDSTVGKGAYFHFYLPVGTHTFTVQFSANDGASRIDYWTFSNHLISLLDEMEHSRFGEEPATQLAGEHVSFRVKKRKPVVTKTGTFEVK